MEAIPQALLEEHFEIQEIIDSYEKLLEENRTLINQMVAMGYQMPPGFEFDGQTGRLKAIQLPEATACWPIDFVFQGVSA